MDIKTQKMLADVIVNAKEKTVAPYSTTAEVKSIVDDTVYVKIPGSENATPVKASSVSVKVGDIVDLVVSHSDTHITGNRSDVAVSSTTAESITQTMEAGRLEMENELDIVGNKMKILNNNIDMQNNTINMQNNTITQMGNTIDQQNNTITQFGNTIEQQGNTITQLNDTVNSQGNSITEIGNKVDQQDNVIKQHGNTITEIDDKVTSQGNTITQINNTVNIHGNSITEIGNKVDSQGNTITQLNDTVTSQGNTITQMNSTIETLDSTVETQGSAIQTLDSSIKVVNSAFVIQNGKLTGISEIMTNLLDSDYVTTDLLNADVAWIEDGKIKQGAIGTVEIADSSITTAKISELSADVITTGTLKTECLILTTDEVDPETGEKKVALITALNAKTKAGEGNILDGAVIKDETIEAAKITVVDLNAFGATIGNFHIGTSSMYNNKTSLTDPTNGVYIGTDGIALGQGSLLNMTDDSPFRVESDGDFHLGGKDSNYINFDAFSGELDINAKNIKMGSSSIATVKNVSDSKDAAISAAADDATAKANNAKSEAVSAVNETLKSYATLDITNNKISSAVTESKAYTDAIQIGGRNLLFDTETMKSWNKGYFLSVKYNQTDYLYKNNAVKLTNTKSDGSGGGVWFEQSKFNDLANRVGKRTFSIWAKTDDPSLDGYLSFVYKTSTNTLTDERFYISTEWERYTFSYDVTEDLGNGYLDFIYLQIIGTSPIYICYPKLENGNKATDWTPAPEDVEADATNKANGAVTEAKSYVDQTAESIKSTVQDVNGRLTTMEQNADGFTWSIDQTAIVSSVNEYYPSISATELTGGSWSENTPTWTQGKYIWLRIKTTNGKGKIDYSKPVCITGNTGAQGAKGDTGKQGPKGETGATGADGRGIRDTTVTYKAGSSGTTIPTGTWSPSVPSVSDGQYLWTKTVTTYTSGDPTTAYSVGRMGTNGQNGTNGTNGKDGKGIKSTDITYQAWPSGETTPTGTWYSSIQSTTADKPYLWTKTVITYTDNTTSTSYSVGSTPEGIVVGGRNLLIGTKDFSSYWFNNENWSVSSETYKGFTVKQRQYSWNGLYQLVEGVIGETYTFSGYVKKTGGNTYVFTDGHGGAATNHGAQIGTKINEWEHFSVTSTVSTSGSLGFRVENNSNTETTYICGLKLEEGNKATNWTPAPEDVEADAAVKANNAKSEAITAAAADATNKANEAAKTATNYMKFSSDGLTISKDATSASTGKNVNITDAAVNIRNGSEVLASYGENISLYKNGIEAFTIKDSELLKNASSLNGVFDRANRITNESGTVFVGVKGYSSTSATTNIAAGTTYKWEFSVQPLIGSQYTVTRYIVFTSTRPYRKVRQLIWNNTETNNLYITYDEKSVAIPCIYLDKNAVLDLSLNGSVWIRNGGDLNGSAKGLPPLSIGVDNGHHLELDGNEIAAKSDDTTPSILYLNTEGGEVHINDNRNRSIMFENGTMFAYDVQLKNNGNIQGVTTTGVIRNNFQPVNSNGNCVLGYGNYTARSGTTNIYGYGIGLYTSNYLVSNRGLKVLWSGSYYMNANQTIKFSDKASNQLNGIVLAWSSYINNTAKNENWTFVFIPKEHLIDHSGDLYSILLPGGTLGFKYIYVADKTITGHAANEQSKVMVSGIATNPKLYVLRYVYGV